MAAITRFAPSPTGLLHVGHALAAITAFETASDGGFRLRIEDLDRSRARPEFETAVYEDLAWLGISWPTPALHQSTRGAAYATALARLQQRGWVYPCFCTRKEITAQIASAGEAPHGSEPVYPGACRALSSAERSDRMARGLPFALRLDATRAATAVGPLSFVEYGAGPAGEHGPITVEPERLGDIVLARKDLPAAYHLAVVLDDAFQGITCVTRGNDLFAATHVQRLLQALLELPVSDYAHHRLIVDAEGRKFSKRDGAVTLQALRRDGVTPAMLRRRLDL